MASRVQAKFEFPNLFNRLQDALPRLEKVIAATIQTQVGLRFANEGAWNGHEKWAPLKMRQGQILSLTGTLRKSIAPTEANGTAGAGGFVRSQGNVFDFTVEVGSSIAYASVHDKGATIVPKQKKCLRYFNPQTGAAIFSMKSVIPARPFTDQNNEDEAEMAETIENTIAAILEGR